MGFEFSVSYVVVRDDVPVDWDAALHLIERIELRDVHEDNLYGWLDEEIGQQVWPPAALGVYDCVRHARAVLCSDLDALKRELELSTRSTKHFILVEIPGHRVIVSGRSSGDGYGLLSTLDYLVYRLADVGALAAAGFVAFTGCGETGERRDGFTPLQRQRAAAGRAALHADDDAGRLVRDRPRLRKSGAVTLYERLAGACAEAGTFAQQAGGEWERTRRRAYPEGPAIDGFLVALMRCTTAAVFWASAIPIRGVSTPTRWAPVGRKAADVLDESSLSRRGRPRLPSEWYQELRDCLVDSAVYAQYLDGGLTPAHRKELEETTRYGNLRTEARVHLIRDVVALCIEALGYLSPNGLDPFRRHSDLPKLEYGTSIMDDLPSNKHDPYEGGTEEVAVVGIPDGQDLHWDEARVAANAAGLGDDLAALQSGLAARRYTSPYISLDVPGGILAVFPERYEHPWRDLVAKLRESGVLDELGATLGKPYPRPAPVPMPTVTGGRGSGVPAVRGKRR